MNQHTFYAVSVLPNEDVDDYYYSEDAACAVAWDTWRPGFEIGVHRIIVGPTEVSSVIASRITANGVWSK